ncbi:biotin/lipoyl-containing protein [Geoglobus acetivorans]|uniref:Biotin/lipoyl-binding protein n=1 Tax=Geoglobus acetivorans TaxID=565033 RepID=A0ABZ3H5Q9_GEOAI|nr:biotin/lipoyl-binding protein [Geoglobus acetivorans]
MKRFKVSVGGNVYYAEVEKISPALFKVKVDDNIIEVEVEEEKIKSAKLSHSPQMRTGAVEGGNRVVKAMLPGNVTKILVSEGESVNTGDVLLILEAMKMENEITAPANGKVKEIKVSEGQRVETGQVLVVLE